MTEEIRQLLKARMAERKVSQDDLAAAIGIARPNLTRMLNGRSGEVTDNWQKLFAALGVELTLKDQETL